MGGTSSIGARPALALVYHAVTTSPGAAIAPFTVTPDALRWQLDRLLDHGFRFSTFSDHLARRGHDDGPVAVVTFDDGYADFASAALPILAERAVPVTLYVTTGWLRGRGPTAPGPSDAMLHWSQLPELAAAGVELGAHSHRHPHLDTMRPAALRAELDEPKRLLEDALQAPVRSFAYPHGYSSRRVRALAAECGYASAASVRNAYTHAGDDPFAVARLMLTAGTSRERFEQWLSLQGAPMAGAVETWRSRAWRLARRTRALARRAPLSDYA